MRIRLLHQTSFRLLEIYSAHLNFSGEDIEIYVPARFSRKRDTGISTHLYIQDFDVIPDVKRSRGADRTHQLAPGVGLGGKQWPMLNPGREINRVRPDKYLQHSQRRILGIGSFLVPKAASGVHNQEVALIHG